MFLRITAAFRWLTNSSKWSLTNSFICCGVKLVAIVGSSRYRTSARALENQAADESNITCLRDKMYPYLAWRRPEGPRFIADRAGPGGPDRPQGRHIDILDAFRDILISGRTRPRQSSSSG